MSVRSDNIAVESEPTVAVITVCWNALADLQTTIASVQGQDYSRLLHVVVDGGSTDGTAEWLAQHGNKFAVAVSEPDRGIYDAMNKAVGLSPAVDWFIFLNAGDAFHANDVIRQAIPGLLRQDVAFVFGNVCITDAAGPGQSKIHMARRHSIREMPGCHQSCFVRADVMRSLKFNLAYRVAGDFEFWLRASQRDGAATAFVNHTIATIAPEGFSAKNEPILQRDYFNALRTHVGVKAAAWWLMKRKLRRAALSLRHVYRGLS